ncbi:anthranilate phosphoribosyltransferase [Amorphus suaedae]
MSDLKGLINKVAQGDALNRAEARRAFDIMMSGEATPSQMGGLLLGLRVRGETIDEIAGAVETMREKMLRVVAPEGAMDIVGTGGDAKGTYNVSTCSAFVVAGAGIPVAKHGNRALSSKSGAADVLAALGINIELGADAIGRCVRDAGVGFMFAPAHHAAMKHVGPTRVELGTRTIFNILGPLSNPAGVKRQLVGVFDGRWVEPIAHALKELGSEKVWVVHGADGLDEVTVTAETHVAAVEDGEVRTFTVTPEDAGLPRWPLDQLIGSDAHKNATALRDVLEGKPGAYRDIVLMNAAAAFIVADRVDTLREGAALAAEIIDSGRALDVLGRLVTSSNE